jgi:hypothetical protein
VTKEIHYYKKNLHIVDDVTYKHMQIFNTNSLYYGLHKMIKSGKNCRFEIYMLKSSNLLFLCSLEYKVVEHNFCMFLR